MKHLQRLLDWIDARERSLAPSAFVVGVIKKYGDDRAGSLAALVTFYGFLAVFPLLLLFITVVGIVVGPSSNAERHIVDSALSQFPVIGDQLRSNIRTLSRGEPFPVVISALGLLWGSFGVTNALQQASAQVWGVPRHREPNMAGRVLKGLELLGVVAVAVLFSSALAGASTIGAHYFGNHVPLLRAGVFVAALAVNMAAYLAALAILSPPDVHLRQLLPGTVLGGAGWTVLQALGGYLIGHELQRTSQIYGFFAIVLGLVLWLNLGAQLFLYAAEVNVVHVRRLWPRDLFGPDDGPAAADVSTASPESEPAASEAAPAPGRSGAG